MVEEIGRPDVRELLYGNYRAIYRYDGREVLVYTIYHSSRVLHPERFLP